MNSDLVSQIRFIRRVSVLLAVMVLAFVSLSSSQPAPRPPSWSVQAADPTHGLLTLRGSVMVGVDTGMFYVVQFRIQGTGANQLANFQPSMPVTLESSGPKLQPSGALGATVRGRGQQTSVVTKSPAASTVFTGIPSVGQALLIQASALSAIEGVVASVIGPQSYTAGQPGPACCAVTAFNSQTGVARAKVNTSGQIFVFQTPLVPPSQPHEGPPPLPSYQQINVGQAVWANLATGQVSLDGRTACCQITAEGTSLSGTGGKGVPAGVMNPSARNSACCEITALNQQGKTATAKVKSNGQVFQIAIVNSTLFQSLRVGQPIWANFQTRQVSLNGVQPIDGMQMTGSANVGGPLIAKGPGTRFTGRKPPYTAIPSPNSPPLTLHDHTLIMQAISSNPSYLQQRISQHNWKYAAPKQNAMGAMLLLLEARSVPEPIKERIRVAVQALKTEPNTGSLTAVDMSFAKEVGIAVQRARDAASALKVLDALQQKYANQPRYETALRLAKTLVVDGAPSIYSPAWMANNLQQSGRGLVTYDFALACSSGGGGSDGQNPASGDDLGISCLDGGGDPYPPCPDGSSPPCTAPPTTCPDGSSPPCASPPTTCPDGSSPPCTEPPTTCPDGSSPPCTEPPPLTCPDGSAPPCQMPPATCPDGSSPPWGSPCPAPPLPPIGTNAIGYDVGGCVVGAVGGAVLTAPAGGEGALPGCLGGAIASSGNYLVKLIMGKTMGPSATP